MEVTRKNFSQVLQALEKVISESAFLAIDGEFTGLVNGPDVKAFDTTSEYYRKLRDGSMKFLFVQFGLSAFKFNSEGNKWTHNTYNFYIFARPYNRFIEDPRFTCQSSSIDFLVSNGFDFNKVFREGIPYMTKAEEERQRKYLTDRHSKSNQNGGSPTKSCAAVPVPEEYEAFIAKTCTLIDEFLASDKEELELERTGAFLRKLLYQMAEEKYPGVARLDTRPTDDGSRVLFVTREGSEEDRQEREREKQQREVQELDDAFGFSKVIRLLSQSGKLLIGHNMLLDVCHMLNRFCSSLPQEYFEFKEMVKSTFPRIVDTKYLASGPAFKNIKSTVLCDLYRTLSEEPFELPAVDAEEGAAGFSSVSGRYHEAGYDAYITGICFLAMAQHLGNQPPMQDVSSLPLLQPYTNKVMLTRLQDIDHINLDGDDPNPPRDHVFHISFPKEWRFNDITKVFSQFGNIFIAWIDDTSAYVSLYEREQAASVIKKLPTSAKYRVTPFVKFHQALAGNRVPSSPTTSQLRQRSQERLAEAEAGAGEQGAGNRKRKSTGPARESKFSRRSIDTIVEEDDLGNNPGGLFSIFSPWNKFNCDVLLVVFGLHIALFAHVSAVCFSCDPSFRSSPLFVRSLTTYLFTSLLLLYFSVFRLGNSLKMGDGVVSRWRFSAIVSAVCYTFFLHMLVFSLLRIIFHSDPIPLAQLLHNSLFNYLLGTFLVFSIPMPVIAINLMPVILIPVSEI